MSGMTIKQALAVIQTEVNYHAGSDTHYRAERLEQSLTILRAEIEALRAEVKAWRELSDHVRVGACNVIWPDRYTDERTRDVAAALKRAERLAEALRELEEREQRDEALLRQALEALELRCGTHADERKELIPALRERLGEETGHEQ